MSALLKEEVESVRMSFGGSGIVDSIVLLSLFVSVGVFGCWVLDSRLLGLSGR